MSEKPAGGALRLEAWRIAGIVRCARLRICQRGRVGGFVWEYRGLFVVVVVVVVVRGGVCSRAPECIFSALGFKVWCHVLGHQRRSRERLPRFHPSNCASTSNTMVINPTYLAQRTRQCESSPYNDYRMGVLMLDSCQFGRCPTTSFKELSGMDPCCTLRAVAIS